MKVGSGLNEDLQTENEKMTPLVFNVGEQRVENLKISHGG